MKNRRSILALVTLSLSLAVLASSSCHESRSGATTAALPTFSIQSVSIVSGEVDYPLNRPIVVSFNRPVDFSTVSSNTFRVAPTGAGGASAVGEYVLVNERTVRFQPACPTAADLSDSGLERGLEYTVRLTTVMQEGVSIAALNDDGVLGAGFTGTIQTADSDLPGELFVDLDVDPPGPVIRAANSSQTAATRLEIGADINAPVYFERTTPSEAGTPPMSFLAPLNLYSVPASRVDVLLVLDQAVHPSSANISNERLRLEFLLSTGPDVWQDFPCDVVLERNCGVMGTEVRLIPLGSLPQGRAMRIVIEDQFEDLTGQATTDVQLDFAGFDTATALDPGTSKPGDAADEIFEPFTLGGTSPGSLEDVEACFDVPAAAWNENDSGVLRGNFVFENAGGPNGDFDVIIPGGVFRSFSTISQVLLSGPGGLPSASQEAVGGLLHVRHLTIEAGAIWRMQGPNPVTIVASGDVRIDGAIRANGLNATPISTLNTPILPQPGAAGVAGGGTGGTGSPITHLSSPRGGAGTGGISFVAGGGGGGGESGIATVEINFGENRRAGGGGGGVLGSDTLLSTGCPNEDYIGLNAETGHLGATTGMGAVTGVSPPQGGVTGPGPFSDSSAINNFWGTLLVDPDGPSPMTVHGELDRPWAGAGGGAGGDATTYTASVGYPDPNFPFSREDRGAGGGGGGGSVTILALGSITFGPAGRIEVMGGHGAGGEPTNFTNRVGGGSGGGSGGHVILQSARSIDFSQVATSPNTCPGDFACLSIVALGGQGGAGSGNGGGWDSNNPAAGNPMLDSKPASFNASGQPCDSLPRICAGGDGGPGIIQLHAPTLADIIPPGGLPGSLRTIVRPSPIGLNELSGQWDGQLLPAFGDVSRAQSKWIPLGAMRIAPRSSVPEAVQYIFRGTDPVTGFVTATGEVVDSLPPILSGTLATPGTFPYVDADGVTVVFAVTDLTGADDLYRRNPRLMEFFELQVTAGTQLSTFEVVSATTDEVAGELRLTVQELPGGTTLAAFNPGDSVELVPRFFGIRTDGIDGYLPDNARVAIRFQAAPALATGGPNEAKATAPTSDISQLTNSSDNIHFRYFRFVIEFDVAAGGVPLTPANSIPALDFLRVPFRF